MRRFVRDIVLFLFLQALLCAAVLRVSFNPDNIFLGITRLKHQRLEQTPSPRIILVGGSNLLGGLDSETLEKELPSRRVVSMGVTVGLGLPFMLCEVSGGIRAGDIVVVVPEWELLVAGNTVADSQAYYLSQIVLNRPAALSCIPWRAAFPILERIGMLTLGEAARSAKFRWKRFQGEHFVRSERELQRQFNSYGDAIFFRDEPSRYAGSELNLKALDGLPVSIQRLNDFAQRCEKKGATVLYSFPPLPDTLFNQKTQQLAVIEGHLRRDLRFPLLGEPSSMTFTNGDFFDMHYHLRGEAVHVRTRRLAALIRAHVSDEGRTAAERPVRSRIPTH